jgi:hypothetical protein
MATTHRVFVERLESRMHLSAAKLLFIRGADRSGGFLEAGNDTQRTEHLCDIDNLSTSGGNHGWGMLAAALRGQGFVVEQITESIEPGAPSTGPVNGQHIEFQTLNLDQYAAIVFGSNNAVYDTAAIDAVENYIRRGGAALFISDANWGSNWGDAPSSDQQFLDRFGWVMNQDTGTYSLQRSLGDFVMADHPIFAGVNTFDGEGVSPINIEGATVPTARLAVAKGTTRLNNNPSGGSTRAVNAFDSSLVVGSPGSGRIAGHFDRNTFFNTNGAGTWLDRFDNRTYAINLFNWLAFAAGPITTASQFTFELSPRTLRFTFDRDASADVSMASLTLTNLTGAAALAPAGFSYESATHTAVFELPANAPDANYRATLSLAGPARSLDFCILAGDANRDRKVDVADLGILASNWQQSGRTFSQGNFDYSASGLVDVADLGILASSWQHNVPPPSAPVVQSVRRTPRSVIDQLSII